MAELYQDWPASMRFTGDLVWLIGEAAYESARRLGRRYRRARRVRRGATLRPGPDTPLWNRLVRELRPLLRRRGDKAHLGRLLGVPRQRVHDFLVGTSRLPDAEHTLLLLEWMIAVRRRREREEAERRARRWGPAGDPPGPSADGRRTAPARRP